MKTPDRADIKAILIFLGIYGFIMFVGWLSIPIIGVFATVNMTFLSFAAMVVFIIMVLNAINP